MYILETHFTKESKVFLLQKSNNNLVLQEEKYVAGNIQATIVTIETIKQKLK